MEADTEIHSQAVRFLKDLSVYMVLITQETKVWVQKYSPECMDMHTMCMPSGYRVLPLSFGERYLPEDPFFVSYPGTQQRMET
ncbi:hypothetical protein STEG23_023886 [Scotinomys teguina]